MRLQQQGKCADYTGMTFIEKMQMKCAYVPPYVDPFADSKGGTVDAKRLCEPVLPLGLTKNNVAFADDTKAGKGETPQKDTDYKPAILKKY